MDNFGWTNEVVGFKSQLITMNKQIFRTSKVVQPTVPGPCRQETDTVAERRVTWQAWAGGMVAGLVGAGLALLLVSCKSSAPSRGVRHEVHPEADVAVNTEQAPHTDESAGGAFLRRGGISGG